MVSPNAKSGDTQNNYQQERQIIDDYLKQINPNFSTGELCVITDLINKQHFSERYEDVDEFMVSTDGLVSGMYFMRIYRNGELLDTQKLIVK